MKDRAQATARCQRLVSHGANTRWQRSRIMGSMDGVEHTWEDDRSDKAKEHGLAALRIVWTRMRRGGSRYDRRCRTGNGRKNVGQNRCHVWRAHLLGFECTVLWRRKTMATSSIGFLCLLLQLWQRTNPSRRRLTSGHHHSNRLPSRLLTTDKSHIDFAFRKRSWIPKSTFHPL